MFDETQRLTSPSGATLAYHHQPAVAPARAILMIAHGLAEHSKRYRAFAAAMAVRGLHVYAWDHRGHGETVAPDAPIGRFGLKDGASLVLQDLKAVRDMAAAAHPGLPVVLFGHSMGGLIALNAAIEYPRDFDALAVWNSNFNPGLAGRAAQAILRVEKALKGSDVPSGFLPRLTFEAWGKMIPGHRTLFDWLSHDPEVVDRYIADPLCGFDASVSLWIELFAMTFRGAGALDRLRKDMPVHLAGGAEDPATDNGAAVRWLADRMRQSGLPYIACHIWPATRHETLNEKVADQAARQLADWALAAIPSARVPAEAE